MTHQTQPQTQSQLVQNQMSLLNQIFDLHKLHFGFDQAQLLLSPPKKEIKGFPLKVSKDSHDFLVKILPLDLNYPIESHPSLLEILIPKLLNQYSSESPHIVYIFNHLLAKNNYLALTSYPIKNYHGSIYDESSILVTEFINGGCLEHYVRKPSEQHVSLTEADWKNILFQILWTIAIFQDKLEFMHNDFHAGNILLNIVDIPEQNYVKYKWYAKRNCITFTLPASRYQTKITDFEFAECFADVKATANLYPNDFCFDHSDIPESFNAHYDVHFFLTSLLELDIPISIRNFITSIFPPYLIPVFSPRTLPNSQTPPIPHSPDSINSFSSYSSDDSDDSFYKPYEEIPRTTPPRHTKGDDSGSVSGSDVSGDSRDWSDSRSYSSYSDSESSASTNDDAFIKNGRLLNEKYDLIKHLLSSPLQLIFCHPFFEEYRTEGLKDAIVTDTYRFHSAHGGDPRRIRKLPWTLIT